MKQRIEREIMTVGIMIDLFCRQHHGGGERCRECRELFDYARSRSMKCPFGDDKPVCGRCRIHCYKPGMKEKIREVMKYSGRKMVLSHPILALRHLVDARKILPPLPPSGKELR